MVNTWHQNSQKAEKDCAAKVLIFSAFTLIFFALMWISDFLYMRIFTSTKSVEHGIKHDIDSA